MRYAADLAGLHLDYCRFAESAAAVESSMTRAHYLDYEALAVFGQRLLRLDLVDVAMADRPELADRVPNPLMSRAIPLTFPVEPRASGRGALGDIGALFELLLETFEIRWRRGDMLHVVSMVHLAGEYLGHLAWSDVLGHAADPMQLRSHVDVPNTRWGDVEAEDCGHSRQQRHLGRRVKEATPLRSAKRWGEFLRRDYSRVGEQLLICGNRGSMKAWGRSVRTCDVPCPVWTTVATEMQADLARRVRLAVWMRSSPVMQLRHGAPVGHFFGVPDRDEFVRSWNRLLQRLERSEGVTIAVAAPPEQLAELCSLVAGSRLEPATLVADTVAAMRVALGEIGSG